MFSKSGHGAIVILSVALFWSCSAFSENIIRPPEPEPLPALRPPLTPLAPSMISVPIYVDLSPMLRQINDETVVPKKFDHWGTYVKNPKAADYKYYAERDDFAMQLSLNSGSTGMETGTGLRDWWKGIQPQGSSVFMSAPLRYKIEANSSAQAAGSSVHCGEGNEWPRRATLDGNVALGLTASYNVSASVTGVVVNAIDPCLIRPASLDPTQDVNQRVTDSVRGGLTRAAAPINTMTVKHQVEQVWNALRTPIQVDQDLWLQLNPDRVGQSGVLKGGAVAEGEVQIVVNPTVVRGSEPSGATTALPPLDIQPASPGFHVTADVALDYAALSKSLANRLIGRRVQHKGDVIKITNAEISGHGGNQVVLRVDFNGDIIGHVYMIGKPAINVLTQTIFIGGLDYDSGTAELLPKVDSRLLDASFRELVTDGAIFGVTTATDRMKGLLAAALNRSLSPAVSMRGTVESVQGINVFAATDGLYVQVTSEGTVRVTAGGKP
ncbi:MAG: DUF4403 family protein [Nitrospira sp.]|nr:DUF4403 family protein [Nitrospira sp.]